MRTFLWINRRLVCEMRPTRSPVLLLWLLLCSGAGTEAIEPVSTTIAFGVVATLTAFITNYRTIFNYYYECCHPEWIVFNRTGLEADLRSKLFGQHIASRIILKAVDGFMNNDNPKKPLVLSLHGWTGTGKNFISKLIANNIYKEGTKSSFFHLFASTYHFPHSSQYEHYKYQLKQWIKGNVTICERSMFVFDEMDKMHPGLIDGIKPFLDYYENLDGVSYRKAIFIFLSNAGSDKIVETALDFWNSAKTREEIQLRDLESLLSRAVFNDQQSGFYRTSLIDKNLVDFFVPLLPLESQHIVLCTMAEMKSRGMKPNQRLAEKVAMDLIYFPKTERVFAATGCKTIESKLDYYL
ncbi:torsin family 1 isoform X1 [Pleuronectes platessa]|uniref:torsin family 1 isoform X1 n=1 Tax=Pleuronectes platessa TaxID=8262 RepID=UPI00232A52DE|nr:torsin family 1 isoform X1 [Pleuronectes platessa]